MRSGNGPCCSGNSSDDNYCEEPIFPNIPHELEYLIEPGLHYGGKYQFDKDIQWFLENAEESEVETLAVLAEKVRLSGHYARLLQWMDEIDDTCECIVDEHHPCTVEIFEERRKELLPLINVAGDPPDVAERRREKCLREFVEMDDDSDIAELRRKLREQLFSKACEQTHHMEIYFLFGLMNACDLSFE